MRWRREPSNAGADGRHGPIFRQHAAGDGDELPVPRGAEPQAHQVLGTRVADTGKGSEGYRQGNLARNDGRYLIAQYPFWRSVRGIS